MVVAGADTPSGAALARSAAFDGASVVACGKEERALGEVAADLRHAIFHSTRVRPAVRCLVQASYAFEQRFRPYRLLVTPPKRALQRLGVGRGWLY